MDRHNNSPSLLHFSVTVTGAGGAQETATELMEVPKLPTLSSY